MATAQVLVEMCRQLGLNEPIEMKDGTTFYFVTGGIRSALDKAKDVAGEKDIRLGGGVSTVRQYLTERLIDELHLVFRPIFMGSGEKLFDGLDLRDLGYAVDKWVPGERSVHMLISRQD